jgi:phage tail protein X
MALVEANHGLAESNRGPVESNRGLVESNRGLVEANHGLRGGHSSTDRVIELPFLVCYSCHDPSFRNLRW